MTTSPVAGLVAGLIPGAGAAGTTPGGTDATGEAFLALVQSLLGGATPQPGTSPDQEPALEADAESDQAIDPETDPDADLTPAVQVTTTVPPLVAAAVAAPVATGQVLSGASADATPAQPAGTVLDSPTAGSADQRASAPLERPTSAAGPALSASRAESGAEPAGTSSPAPAGGTSTASTAPAAPSTPATAPVTGPAPLAAVAPGSPPATQQVSRQVFPEVVRVATNPDGPQRVTIKLNPESLGEVRVVLTNRGGTLEVSLAGGSDARQALLEGTPELHRMLESVGRGEARVVVRDLVGTPVVPGLPTATPASSTSAQPTEAGVSADLFDGAGGAGTDGQTGRDPESTPGSGTAADRTPAPTAPSRHTESVARTHPGLDVTM